MSVLSVFGKQRNALGVRSQRHAREIESHRDLHVSKLEATAAELKALLDDAVGQLLDAQEQVCDQCFPTCFRSLVATDK